MADDVCFVVFPMIKHRPPAQISVFCSFRWIPSVSMSVVCLSGERHNTAVNGDASLPMAYGSCSVTTQKTKARGWTSISQLRSIFGGPSKERKIISSLCSMKSERAAKIQGVFPPHYMTLSHREHLCWRFWTSKGQSEQNERFPVWDCSHLILILSRPIFATHKNKTKNTYFPLYTTLMAPRGEKGQWKWRAVNSIHMQLLWKMQFCESLNLTGCSEPNNRKMQCSVQSSLLINGLSVYTAIVLCNPEHSTKTAFLL